MDPSLIFTIPSSMLEIRQHVFRYNGREYFNFASIKPEVSNHYEVLFTRGSVYDIMVQLRTLTPVGYYDVEKKIWYIGAKPFDEQDEIIGWRYE